MPSSILITFGNFKYQSSNEVMMVKLKIALLIVCLCAVILSGCTPEQEQQARQMIKENRCQAYNGYLCSASDDCGLPYLEVIESYCCPIKCGTCNQSCDDGDACTKDSCSKDTEYKCKYDIDYSSLNATNRLECLGIISENSTPSVNLFVMSHCPYGTQVENAMGPVLDTLGDAVKMSINFIANDKGDGTFKSLHGQPEVDEDIRQLCAMKYSPENYMKYILCQNEGIEDADSNWENCANEAGIDSNIFKACAESTEGKTLLSVSIQMSKAMNAQASPTIYINGQEYGGKKSSLSFQKAICQAIPDNAECKGLPECITNADCTTQPSKEGKCNANKCEYVDYIPEQDGSGAPTEVPTGISE